MPARSEACRPQRRRVGACAWTTAAPRRSRPTLPRPAALALVELVPAAASAKDVAGGRYVLTQGVRTARFESDRRLDLDDLSHLLWPERGQSTDPGRSEEVGRSVNREASLSAIVTWDTLLLESSDSQGVEGRSPDA